MNRTPELETALLAARRAAGICTAVYDSLVDAAAKAGREPVTIADYASQAVISATLRAAFPDDAFLGEEHGDEFERVLTPEQRLQVVDFVNDTLGTDYSEADVRALLTPPDGKSGRKWVVDPIDGTKGFLGKRAYAVAIALMNGDDLTMGVLACPNLSVENPGELTDQGTLFYAVRGEGACREDLESGEAVPMHAASTAPGDAMTLVTSYETGHSNKGLFAEVVESLPASQKSTFGLDGQGKYGLVADGRVTCYFRLVPEADYREKVWDHAAGTIIVEEAGGKVTDFHGKALNFAGGRKLTDNRGIVVSNGVIHDALLDAIAKTGWDA